MPDDKDMELNDISSGDYSLESILAEYKGSAFINGDKKTPPELLNEQTERILREVVGSAQSGLLFSPTAADKARSSGGESVRKTPHADDPRREVGRETSRDAGREISREAGRETGRERVRDRQSEQVAEAVGENTRVVPHGAIREARRETSREPSRESSREGPREPSRDNRTEGSSDAAGAGHHAFFRTAKNDVQEERRSPQQKPPEVKDNVVLFFDNYRSPTPETQESIVHEVEEAIKREYGEAPADAGRRENGRGETGAYGFFESEAEEDSGGAAYEVFDEPDLKEATKRFAISCNSISLRSIPTYIITLMMVVLTYAFEAGLKLPLGIGRNSAAAICVLMLMLLIDMILCADIVVKGAIDLFKGAPNAETLVFFSCAFSLISGAFSVLWGDTAILPYCAVSALSLSAAAAGERIGLRAITDTLKTATASSEPYGVQAEYNRDLDKSVLKKAFVRTDGFYNNLVHPDVAEIAYRYATPVLLGASLVLAAVIAIFRSQGVYFLHILSALLAASAPLSATLSYALPFGIVAKSVRKSGAAIAGWGGADDIYFTDGASVTDEDLFPMGTLTLNGMKLFEGASPEKAIRYTASLIIASGSGLSRVFSDVLKAQGMNVIKVEDFVCYESGVSALVRGERVVAGSAAFMELLHVRIPEGMMMKNAVYTAINNKLAAMFSIDYDPIKSVQGALISILKWRIKLFFAVRDFNVSPAMLENKFRVSLEDFEYVQAKNSYDISDSNSGKRGRMAAILTREGLGPFAEAITGSRLLRSAAIIATGVSVAFAAFGLIIMTYLYWSGSLMSARPGNLVLFMIAMLAVVLIVCYYAKTKK